MRNTFRQKTTRNKKIPHFFVKNRLISKMFVDLISKLMPANFYITEHIPVADHVYKYLIKKCGSDNYTANRSDLIGQLILSSLGNNHKDVKILKNTFEKTFSVNIKEDALYKNGFYLSVKSGQVFNKMVDKMFREELYSHAIISKRRGEESHLPSMKDFLDVYDITEDDIRLDTLYRDFKRKKESVIN